MATNNFSAPTPTLTVENYHMGYQNEGKSKRYEFMGV